MFNMRSLFLTFSPICWLFFVSVPLFYHHVSAEVFTAMSDVHNLIDTERNIIGILQQLVQAEKEKIAAIESYIWEFTDIFEKPNLDIERVVSHPVNAFLLVKHLSADWDHLQRYIRQEVGTVAVNEIEAMRKGTRFPEDEDIRGAAEGFVRLQRTYQIETEDFAAGKIPGISAAPELSSLECYLIGHRLALEGEHEYAASWLEIALRKYTEAKEKPVKVREVDILDWLQYSYYHSGNVMRALDLSYEVQALEPTFPTVDVNIQYYLQLLANMTEDERMAMKDELPALDPGGAYEALCRGEGVLSPEITSKLRCYYVTHDNPFLLIQPAKYEVAHVDPDVFILHDVALISQMERVKSTAIKYLQRATVVKSGSTDTEFTKIRISKSAFLGEDVDPVVKEVNKYLGHITNFDMEQAEHLQVANYGIGGHYNAHYDFFRNPNDLNTKQIEANMGDRIATVLMYMTDVEAGGATTFPVLNLTLFPEKGTAAFWFNLHRDGKGDIRTLHEGCPVLSGNKWVSNKWIREVRQDRARPCELLRDSDKVHLPGVELEDLPDKGHN